MDHHYFVSTAFGWGVGNALDEALANAARVSGVHKEKDATYAWSCKVHAPKNSSYSIEFFKPRGVEISDGREWTLYPKGRVVPFADQHDQSDQ